MAELVWQPDSAAMRQFLSGGRGPAFMAVTKMRTVAAAKADSKVPVDTGALKRAQVKAPVVLTGDKVVTGVEYLSPYARFVHEGTRPHPIVPKRKKVLAWIPRGSGRAIYARSVNHPGTKARPWLRESLDEAAQREGFIVEE